MLSMESKKARESYTHGLNTVLAQTGILKAEVLQVIQDMNKTKKGFADITLDYQKVLASLEKVSELAE